MLHSRERWTVWRRGGFLALLMGVAACGGDEPARPAAPDVPVQTPPADPSEPTSPDAAPNNAPPSILNVRFEPERPTVGDSLRAVVETADPEGDPVWLRYVWEIGGGPIDTKAREVALHGVAKGALIEVTVVASDGKNESGPRSVSTRVRNAPPRLERVQIEPGNEIVAGRPIVVRPDARDSDGDAVQFRYRWTVNGRRIYEKGAQLSTENLRRGDTVQVEVIASDGVDESEPLTSPKLAVVNTPPRILSLPAKASDDETFRYQVQAEDPDGDVDLQYHLEKAPEGMRIDAPTGAITWTPSPDQVGVHTVAVVVDDLQGGQTRRTFDLTVGAPGDAPPAAPTR